MDAPEKSGPQKGARKNQTIAKKSKHRKKNRENRKKNALFFPKKAKRK
jgi:hypothetical protein